MSQKAPEDEVKAAAESALGAEARVAGRLDFGNVNDVYRVEAGGRAYALKVFRHADWPEPGKLPWVEASLARAGVPRARMVHYTREAGHFPHGFSVSEFVEGENCKRAVRRGSLSPAAYFGLAGALLKRVHSVGLPLYGYIGGGGGRYEDFVGWLLDCDVRDGLCWVDDGTRPLETLYPLIERAVGPALRRHESRFRPALVHGDCNPKNGVLTPDGGLVLVDWDEAVGGFWVKDYAGLTYWYSYMREGGGGHGGAGLEEARASFFRAYGEPGFDAGELREMERALHVSMAAGEMSYLYKFGDAHAYARARARLLHLLDSPGGR
ncbi:MAG TPA: aminoglycoside phosphotransferase family protein [Pyrinomonadaceae bacterium]|jgi:aminoglycoside phosphotransferase (APT) family kinase protein